MALIRCPDCEREVSSRARACPKCGYPVESLSQNDIVELLIEKGADTSVPEKQPAKVEPPALPPARVQRTTKETAELALSQKVEPPPVPLLCIANTPPPLPEDQKNQRQQVRFIDDTLPVVDDEKYTGPGLICRTCKGQIAAEDIWCAHCKAPIIRRYCGGCRELIPDNAAQCPYCNSSKLHRFRYIRNLEQFVAGAAVLAVLLFIFSVYGPNDGTSYAEKLAQKRSQQQEQTETAAEERSKKVHQERANSRSAVRVVPRETSKETVVQARGTGDNSSIPTVQRIESKPKVTESEKPVQLAKKEEVKEHQDEKEQIAQAREKESMGNAPESDANDESRPSLQMAQQLNAHGFRLMKNGRYAEAIPVLAQAVRSFPAGEKNLTYAYSLYNLGRSLRLVGRPDLAIPILEERMRFADQRHVVARELEMAKAELNGAESVNRVEFE